MPTPNIVQFFTGNAFSTTVSATSGSNIQAGNVLVAFQIVAQTAPANPNGCVTWTQAVQTTNFGGTGLTGTWSVGPVISGGACTSSLTATGANGTLILFIWEVNATSTVVDGTPGFAFVSAAGTVNGPSITTSTSGDMFLAGMVWGTGTVTANSPLVNDAHGASLVSNLTLTGGDLSHMVQNSSGSFTSQYTASSSSVYSGLIALEPSGFQPDEDFWVAPPPAPVDSIISIF